MDAKRCDVCEKFVSKEDCKFLLVDQKPPGSVMREKKSWDICSVLCLVRAASRLEQKGTA